MKNRSKIVISLLLSLIMLLTAGCADNKANTREYDTGAFSEENTENILFQGSIGSNSGEETTSELTAQEGNGRIINVRFRNDGEQKVTVDLRKKSIFSKNNIVMSFEVGPGEEVSNDHRSADSDSGKYSVRIISSSGPDVSGYLEVTQRA